MALCLLNESVSLLEFRIFSHIAWIENRFKEFYFWFTIMHRWCVQLRWFWQRLSIIQASALNFFVDDFEWSFAFFLCFYDAFFRDVGNWELKGATRKVHQETGETRKYLTSFLHEQNLSNSNVLLNGVVHIKLSSSLWKHDPATQNHLDKWNSWKSNAQNWENPLELQEDDDYNPLHEVSV